MRVMDCGDLRTTQAHGNVDVLATHHARADKAKARLCRSGRHRRLDLPDIVIDNHLIRVGAHRA